MLEVLRDHVRLVFNRMEGKLEEVVYKNPLLKFIRLQLENWSKS
jgi:hypothetical protein